MKRDIHIELVESFVALAAERQGRATRRSHKVQLGELATVSADELVALREHLNMSRPVPYMNAQQLQGLYQDDGTSNTRSMSHSSNAAISGIFC